MSKVFPVIHHLNDELALSEGEKAFKAGSDGVFLISHNGDDDLLGQVGRVLKSRYPSMKVGLNFLSKGVLAAYDVAKDYELDMVWGDSCGVDGKGLNELGQKLSSLAKSNLKIEVFASVAFKYQAKEPYPNTASLHAFSAGFIPTTSGAATGSAPELEKIRSMSQASEKVLAVASGMTLENVEAFKPYLSHILVATGVSLDEHRLDAEKLAQFIKLAR